MEETKRFRQMRHPAWAQDVARVMAEHFAYLEPAMRFGLAAGHATQAILGAKAVAGITRAVRAVVRHPFPQWSREMPRPASSRLPITAKPEAQAVYFPSCLSRVMGHLPGEQAEMSLAEAFVRLAERAGRSVWIPDDVAGTCCGVPFSSKGYDRAHAVAANRAIERFWTWSEEGALPIVIDTSPCTYGLVTCRSILTPANQARFDRLRILDSIAFAHDQILSGLTLRRRVRSVALHPVCSVVKMNLATKLEAIARFCCDQVTVPANAGCCGFAGDRGFLFPELTEAATRREAAEILSGQHEGYYSSSRTCEIGMTRATGQIYRSYIFLLERATRI